MSQVIQFASHTVETPGGSTVERGDPAIRTDAVYVVYTSTVETLAAVRVAGDFAKALGVPVTLIHFRTVHHALPVDAPCGISPVETDAFLTRLRAENVDVRVHVCLCRNEREGIPMAFKQHSLIVIAGRHSAWPSESKRWRGMLEAAGHFVVFVDTAEKSARSPRHASSATGPSFGWAQGSELVEGRASGAGALQEVKKEKSHA